MLRDFYYDLLSRHERMELHRRAADYYRDVEPDPLRAARQFLCADDAEQATLLATEDGYDILARGQANRLAASLTQLEATTLPPLLASKVKLAATELYQFYRDADAAFAAGSEALTLLAALRDDSEARRFTAELCWTLNRVTAPTDPVSLNSGILQAPPSVFVATLPSGESPALDTVQVSAGEERCDNSIVTPRNRDDADKLIITVHAIDSTPPPASRPNRSCCSSSMTMERVIAQPRTGIISRFRSWSLWRNEASGQRKLTWRRTGRTETLIRRPEI